MVPGALKSYFKIEHRKIQREQGIWKGADTRRHQRNNLATRNSPRTKGGVARVSHLEDSASVRHSIMPFSTSEKGSSSIIRADLGNARCASDCVQRDQ